MFNKTLGIFTVKKISFFEGKYYTYGGFGSYLNEIRKYFTKVILVAHVKNVAPEEGYYLIPHKNLKVIHLLQCRNELENILQIPYNFYLSFKAVKSMNIVHCRMPDYTGIFGAVLSIIFKKEYFIQTIADWGLQGKKTSIFKKYGLGLFLKIHYFIYDYFERLLCKKGLVFCQGSSSYNKHKNNPDSIIISSTAHYDNDIAPLKINKKIGKNIKLLHVGRLTGVKNQELLIHTVSKLNKNSNLNFYLNILGEGPRRSFLEGLIVDLKQTKYVKLLGQLDRDNNFWNYFDKSDIFLLSSRSEGTPKVLLEAMARSLPVIATNVGGIPYMVKDGERGMLYEDDNLDQLCLNISTLLENKNLRNSIIKNAYTFSKNNTLEKSTKNMIDQLAKYFKWVE